MCLANRACGTPLQPVLVGVACAPPRRAFPGTRCGDTHVPASNAQNLPPAGWLLPKGREAGARAGCCLPVLSGQLPTGPSLPGITERGNRALRWEDLPPDHREGAAHAGPVKWQHISARTGRFWGPWAVPIKCCSSVCEGCFMVREALWWSALYGVRFWMARDSVAERCQEILKHF